MTRHKIRSITVIGRKWFDKVNGNTYCTAQIIINGKTAGITDFEYGYGDFYTQAAGVWLERNGYIKLEKYANGGSQMLWSYCSKNNIAYEAMSFYCLKRELTRRSN
jgi:hypothetical protein